MLAPFPGGSGRQLVVREQNTERTFISLLVAETYILLKNMKNTSNHERKRFSHFKTHAKLHWNEFSLLNCLSGRCKKCQNTATKFKLSLWGGGLANSSFLQNHFLIYYFLPNIYGNIEQKLYTIIQVNDSACYKGNKKRHILKWRKVRNCLGLRGKRLPPG